MDSAKRHIEQTLAQFLGRRFCCLTNRGTTALSAALAALDLPAGAPAFFPTAMCSVPVFSARFAGLAPAFADVDPADGNFDIKSLLAEIDRWKIRAGAVVPVNMFGRPDRLEDLQALCQERGLSLIEDLALSLGALHKGKKVGSFGRLACLSFVRKIIPLEMGGAVLTDEAELDARVRRFVEALPPAPENAQALAGSAMKEFHTLTARAAQNDWRDKSGLAPYEEIFKARLLASTSEADWRDSIVLDELQNLEGILSARRARAEVYESVLNHPRLLHFETAESGFFAYPLRLAGVAAEDFLDFAAGRGFALKRLSYPDIHPIFTAPRAMPQAALIEKEVIGLPVDDNAPASAFWGYAAEFLRHFEDYLAIEKDRPAFDWRGCLELRMS